VDAPPRPSLAEVTRVFLRIGLLSFGGPAGQIAMMHKELVDDRRWIGDKRFLHALNYCMLLPGPEAQQLATYIGFLLHGTRGALIAGGLFVLPGALVVLGLSITYATLHRVFVVDGALYGLKAAVIAIVLHALERVGKRALHGGFARGIAVASFVALAMFAVPFPIVVALAALLGLAFGPRKASAADDDEGGEGSVVDAMLERGELAHVAPSRARAIRTAATFAALWLTPLVVVRALLGPSSVFAQETAFFAKTALVTFGGAYAVLAYVAQRAVEGYGWLSARQMVDGLGLAETTPGPLILVLEFVGFLGAYHAHGTVAAGVLGAALTVWTTFVPCFLWVLLGAPWMERLRRNAALSRSLAAVTAAVVGVIANLAFYFAVHALFADVTPRALGPVTVTLPVLASLDRPLAVLSVVAIVATFRFHVSMPKLVAAGAVLGVAVRALA
jgi:chromate transporter